MYQINRNPTEGTIQLSDSWSISATGSSAAPQLLQPGDEFVFSYIELEGVEKFKTFTYDYLGRTENRFLETFYRISRDGQSYTNWLSLAPSIGNFPDIGANQIWIDIKFVRRGTSTVGSIKILEYTLNGTLARNVVQGDQPINLTTEESTFQSLFHCHKPSSSLAKTRPTSKKYLLPRPSPPQLSKSLSRQNSLQKINDYLK
jgi:hypothetical protein